MNAHIFHFSLKGLASVMASQTQLCIPKTYLTWAFCHGGGGGGGGIRVPFHNFVVIVPNNKFNVFYEIVTKMFVSSLLLCNYGVIICILADA